jgi:hypothetical protein
MSGMGRPQRGIGIAAMPERANAVLALAVLTLAVIGFGCTPPPATPADASGGGSEIHASLEGRWTVCMTEATRGRGPLCAPLTAERRGGGRDSVHYAVTHELPLDSLLGSTHRPPPYGVIAPADSGRWRLLLGVDAGVVNAFDVGLHGTLTPSGDSLAGTWTHSCFAGCPEQGRVVLRR